MAQRLVCCTLGSRCCVRQTTQGSRSYSLRNFRSHWPSQAAERQGDHVPNAAATLEQPQYEQQYSQPSARAFADFSIYKGKGAMTTKLINPTWRSLNSGGQTVDREGTLLLEFAEPLPSGTAPGERRYNWDKKQTIGLSAMELGKLLDPGPERKIELYHDPNKGSPAEGTITKNLQIKEMEQAGSWMFNLSVTEGSNRQQTKINVSVSRNEMAVLRVLATYLIPHLLGFDEVAASFNLKQPAFDTPPF